MRGIKIAGIVFALCSLSALADDITAEKYPDADVVLVDERVETTYQADGTYVSTEEDWKKALTERGRRSLSSLSIGYSLRYGKGEILLVEIIDADGKVRAVDFASTLKEATDNSSTAANIYDPLDKVLSCSIPGIKVGETLHVKTRRTVTKSRVKDQWADMEIFESTMPIVRSSVRIDGPLSRPLKKIAVRNPLGNVVSSVVTNGERVVYSWTAENSPQMFPEPAMPPYWTQGQNLRVSTAASWQELSKWYWDVSVPHLEKTNAAMTNKVEEIMGSVGANAAPIDKVRAMYKFVSQEIRYMGLTMEDTSPGYAPHDVDLTFDNRYGVCRDKAALLVAMFRIAGFESYPVLISVSAAKMDNEVPTPFFNHAIVAVKLDGDYILMDPTDESSRDLCPAYLGDCSYLVAHPSGEGLRTAPVVPPSKNAVTVVGSGRLGKDGSLLADHSILFCGINDNAFRRHLLSLKPEQRRELFERAVEGVSAGAELMRCDIEPKDLQDTAKELKVKLLVKYPEVLLRGETRDELSVPSLSSALGAANWLLSGRTALESRKYPLKVSSTALADEKMEIDLAGAVGATASMPDDETIKGGYEFTRTFRRDGDKLVFERRLSIGAVEFSPDEYLNLRESIKRVEAAERERPAFAKDRFANANERIVSSVRTYDLSGDSSWVSTNTVVKEILTYKGKKSAAELKFSYNPSWKTVELVSASVSNRNGQVVFAGPKETSVLDADWVSSAPRYPASKELVVNLPSVEIGSVISYTVVTTVKDAPLPFYANFYFDTFTPTDFLSVRVGDWKREVKSPRLLPDEKMLPPGVLWRDHDSVSLCDFAAAAAKYRALDPDRPRRNPRLDGAAHPPRRTRLRRNPARGPCRRARGCPQGAVRDAHWVHPHALRAFERRWLRRGHRVCGRYCGFVHGRPHARHVRIPQCLALRLRALPRQGEKGRLPLVGRRDDYVLPRNGERIHAARRDGIRQVDVPRPGDRRLWHDSRVFRRPLRLRGRDAVVFDPRERRCRHRLLPRAVWRGRRLGSQALCRDAAGDSLAPLPADARENRAVRERDARARDGHRGVSVLAFVLGVHSRHGRRLWRRDIV